MISKGFQAKTEKHSSRLRLCPKLKYNHWWCFKHEIRKIEEDSKVRNHQNPDFHRCWKWKITLITSQVAQKQLKLFPFDLKWLKTLEKVFKWSFWPSKDPKITNLTASKKNFTKNFQNALVHHHMIEFHQIKRFQNE